MSKTKSTSKTSENKDDQKEIVYVQPQHGSFYLMSFILCIVTLVLGMLIQQNDYFSMANTNGNGNLKANEDKLSNHMEQALKNMGINLKKEILEAVQLSQEKQLENLELKFAENHKANKKDHQKKVVEVKKVSEDLIIEENSSSMKLGKENEQIVIDAKKLQDQENEGLRKKKLDEKKAKIERAENEKKLKMKKSSQADQQNQKSNKVSAGNGNSKNNKIPDVVNNFKSSTVSRMKPKKMWIPIPNR